MRALFDFLACREDVASPKPEPDLYRHVLEHFGLRGHEAIAFEDSHTGTLAAKRAGLWVVAVPNVSTGHHDFSQADLRVASLADCRLAGSSHASRHEPAPGSALQRRRASASPRSRFAQARDLIVGRRGPGRLRLYLPLHGERRRRGAQGSRVPGHLQRVLAHDPRRHADRVDGASRAWSGSTGPTSCSPCATPGARAGLRHFFYGGGPGVADELASRLTERFPGLAVAGTFTPPFRELDDAERAALAAASRAPGPTSRGWASARRSRSGSWRARAGRSAPAS